MQDKTPWPIQSLEIDKAKQLLDSGATIELTYCVIEVLKLEEYHEKPN